MTTGVWTRLQEVALFGPSSLFWFNSLLFIPLLSQPHLILLRAKKTPLFWGELTQANRSTLKPVTKALFQSHVITHQCHTTHTFQTGRVALWACRGKLSTLWMQDTVIWIKSPLEHLRVSQDISLLWKQTITGKTCIEMTVACEDLFS